MLHGKRITVVLPAYNASPTLRQTFAEIPRDIVGDVILTDDASNDGTASLAEELGIRFGTIVIGAPAATKKMLCGGLR